MNDFIDDYSVGNDSLHENHVVVFGNQKGGVGKTTICAHFANYLANERKVPVLVIDADLQQNLLDHYNDDKSQIQEGTKMPYIVRGLSLSNSESVRTFMSYCKTLNGTTIVDAPGNLTQQALVELLSAADYILVPFTWDMNSIRSTKTFILTVLKLRQANPRIKPHLIFFNNMKKREGRTKELETWKKMAKFFTTFGYLAEPVGEYVDIKRYNTIETNKNARKYLKSCFDSIFHIIYKTSYDE